MRGTRLWQIIRRFPKGSLLHAHFNALIDAEWLVDRALNTPGLCISSEHPMISTEDRSKVNFFIQFSSSAVESWDSSNNCPSLWDRGYQPFKLVPLFEAGRRFPDDESEGFKNWLIGRCRVEPDNPANQILGPSALQETFGRCFPIVDSMLFYEPIFKQVVSRVLRGLVEDNIIHAEWRILFFTSFYRQDKETPDENFHYAIGIIQTEINRIRTELGAKGKHFLGVRLIWTIRRRSALSKIKARMQQCIEAKKLYRTMICGIDLAGLETDKGSLLELMPVLTWFQEECTKESMDIPFFFHAGECTGDGTVADNNLYDAVLLSSRRIGHAHSLIKHPVLMDMVKRQNILIESCPISNQVLRLTGSIRANPLPALLAHGIPVAISNDDPAMFGNDGPGISSDFWHILHAFDNVGLSGLASLAENSVRWSCLEDQSQEAWSDDIMCCLESQSRKAQEIRRWREDYERFCRWIVDQFAGSSTQS